MSEPLAVVPGFYGEGSTDPSKNLTQALSISCEGGFFCTSGQRTKCGGGDLFCPPEASSPSTVQLGWYSTGGSTDTRTGEATCEAGSYCQTGVKTPCPPGRYGSGTALYREECTGLCREGYWCGAGSTEATPHACSEGYPKDGIGKFEVYCPAGSEMPTVALKGHYTTPRGSDKATGQRECEAGFYCRDGVRKRCGDVSKYCPAGSTNPIDVIDGEFSMGGSVSKRQTTDLCPAGSWCKGGVKSLCDAGYYGDAVRLSDKTCSGPCYKGYACIQGSTTPDDSSTACLAGYYCPSRSSAKEKECGGAMYYCPAQSTDRATVKVGWYSSPLEVSASLRQNALQCGPGFRCVAGERLPCATASSVGGAEAYFCQGGINATVGEGNYSDGGVSGHKSTQEICTAGWWCQNGIKRPCPAGKYGASSGLSSSDCSGNCSAG